MQLSSFELLIQRPIYEVTRSQQFTNVVKNPVTRNAHQAVTNVYWKLFERFKLISTDRKASYVNFWKNYPMILKLRYSRFKRGARDFQYISTGFSVTRLAVHFGWLINGKNIYFLSITNGSCIGGSLFDINLQPLVLRNSVQVETVSIFQNQPN